jgi:hypothetical protein
MTDAKKGEPNIHLKLKRFHVITREAINDLAMTVKLLITSFTRAIDVVHLPLETPTTAS